MWSPPDEFTSRGALPLSRRRLISAPSRGREGACPRAASGSSARRSPARCPFRASMFVCDAVTGAGSPRLRDDLGSAVLLRVSTSWVHFSLPMAGQHFRIIDDVSDETGWPRSWQSCVGDDRATFWRASGTHVVLSCAPSACGRDDDGARCDLLKFERLGVRRARHAGELAVHRKFRNVIEASVWFSRWIGTPSSPRPLVPASEQGGRHQRR